MPGPYPVSQIDSSLKPTYMKKFRTILLATAILAGIGSSLAFKSYCFDCRTAIQYYYFGNGYRNAGTMGVQYICVDGSTACTYYLVGLTYYPCQIGT